MSDDPETIKIAGKILPFPSSPMRVKPLARAEMCKFSRRNDQNPSQTLYFIQDTVAKVRSGPLLFSLEAYQTLNPEQCYFLDPTGAILQHGKAIGLVEDIVFTGEMVDLPEPTEEAKSMQRLRVIDMMLEQFKNFMGPDTDSDPGNYTDDIVDGECTVLDLPVDSPVLDPDDTKWKN